MGMLEMSEEEYQKMWRSESAHLNKPIVSIRVVTPNGIEGYADLTRGIYFGELPIKEFSRALKTFLPNLIR